jgi:hypothetical protein
MSINGSLLEKRLREVDDPQENELPNIISDTVTDRSEISSNLFSCDTCQKGFLQKWKLDRHLSYSHKPKKRIQKLESKDKTFVCSLCELRSPTKYSHELHIVTSHIDIRVSEVYNGYFASAVPPSFKKQITQKALTNLKKYFQGKTSCMISQSHQIHSSDHSWLYENREKLCLQPVLELFSRDKLAPLQHLWLNSTRDDSLQVGPFMHGRTVRKMNGKLQIIYPIRDYFGYYVTELDDGVIREVATLEALKYDISEFFPNGFHLKKSNNALVVEFESFGVSLRSLMSKKMILLRHGVNILKLLVVAINRLHGYGYAHRDLTPDNIYVSDEFD